VPPGVLVAAPAAPAETETATRIRATRRICPRVSTPRVIQR
jgi:hypothetical protein